MTSTPNWIRPYIDDLQIEAVSAAVANAESKTSAEIVPVVVRKSSTLGHVPMVLLLILANVGLVLYSAGYFSGILAEQWWASTSFLVAAILLTRWLAPQSWVGRLLTSHSDQLHQVEQRALIEFYNHAAGNTENHTGVLLFVSLLEHQAVVLADKTIADKLPADTWDHVIATMLQQLKQKNLSAALHCGIDHCGTLLAEHFPRPTNDQNELPNCLIIKD